MRDSDARWLERDVVPLLESLGAAVQQGALRTRLAETTAAAKHRLEGRRKPATAQVHRMRRNPTVEHYSADVDGQKVPYVDIVRFPCVWTESGCAEQVYPEVEWVETSHPEAARIGIGLVAYSYEPMLHWDGDWCWEITVDDRISYHFECREDVEMVLPVLAEGMAVAAGFTSHGPHSFPANRHGPAVGLAPFTDPEPAELVTSEGFGPEAIADAVAERLRSDKPTMTQAMLIRWLEAWKDHLVQGGAAKARVDEVSEMVASARGNRNFPGWPFDLDASDADRLRQAEQTGP